MGKYTLTKSATKFRKEVTSPINNDMSYSDLQVWQNAPFVGGLARARMQQMEHDENERWWSDYEKWTGIKRQNIPYPIRNGLYNHPTGSYDAFFEASQSIIDFYTFKGLMKW